MHADAAFSDTIRFEIPKRPAAAHLCRRLRARWLESLEEDDGRWIVCARLRAETGDLATLLREVETWVAERGLYELWFELDGRSYLLRAPHVDSPTVTAA